MNESLETSIPGVFAAGNVLHVHDLVDYVSEEAAAAGVHAARYILQGQSPAGKEIPIRCESGVRYTVPVSVRPQELEADAVVPLRFRVGNVYQNKRIVVYAGETQIFQRKARVLAPGEMETVNLKASVLQEHGDAPEILVKLEDA